MTRIFCGEGKQADDGCIQIFLARAGEELWGGLAPVRVGAASGGEPDAIVVLKGSAARRFDVFCHRPAAMFVFEAQLWAGWLALGFGDCVTLVSLADDAQHEHRLDGYFSKLRQTDDALLALSAGGIARLNRVGALVWQRRDLGIDGVIVREIAGGVIRGEGEWDPPGGWKPFALDFATGEPLERV